MLAFAKWCRVNCATGCCVHSMYKAVAERGFERYDYSGIRKS